MPNLYFVVFYNSLDQKLLVKANKLKVSLTNNNRE